MSRNRVWVREEIDKGNNFSAEILDGEVIGGKPIGITEMNNNINACIRYLEKIKSAMEESKNARSV